MREKLSQPVKSEITWDNVHFPKSPYFTGNQVVLETLKMQHWLRWLFSWWCFLRIRFVGKSPYSTHRKPVFLEYVWSLSSSTRRFANFLTCSGWNHFWVLPWSLRRFAPFFLEHKWVVKLVIRNHLECMPAAIHGFCMINLSNILEDF